jgi:hypothetical protein
MNVSRSLLGLAGVSLLLAGGAFAGAVSKGSLRLYENVTIQGRQIPAGDYRLEWTGSGPDVQVTILNGKETVATVPSRLIPVATKGGSDGYATSKQQDGSLSVTEIFFSGKKYELQVGQESAANPQPAATSGSNN